MFKDLTFFYKALYEYIDVNVNKYIAFIGHAAPDTARFL
jgi:hypothetical protein